jgi:hypothetical protein
MAEGFNKVVFNIIQEGNEWLQNRGKSKEY